MGHFKSVWDIVAMAPSILITGNLTMYQQIFSSFTMYESMFNSVAQMNFTVEL